MTRKAAKKPKAAKPADPLAGPAPERQQCEATTAKGERCKRLAVDGGTLCAVHLGAPVGRTPKLTDDIVERVVQILKVGGYVEAAAAAAGVSKQTFYNWIERGDPAGTRKVDEPFREFRRRIEQARAEGEARNVTLIASAASKDWKAAAWMLERQFPDRWGGPRSRLFLGHPDDPPGAGAAEDPGLGPPVNDDQLGPDGRPL